MSDTLRKTVKTLDVDDLDAIGVELAKIEFVRAAIVRDDDGDLFMNEYARDGATEILTEALDMIRGIVNQKDGTATMQPEGAETSE